jgi:hypothetical protein
MQIALNSYMVLECVADDLVRPGMRLTPIDSDQHLWAAAQVFPPEIATVINSITWGTQPGQQLKEIGRGLRRSVTYEPERDQAIDQYARQHLVPAIQQQCGIEFTELATGFNLQVWIDLPGFRPHMHTDGDKPSALQVYWTPEADTSLGTAFYTTSNRSTREHYFASEPNTGYLLLNTHEPRRLLWHDMERHVPVDIERMCLYFSFGAYAKLK